MSSDVQAAEPSPRPSAEGRWRGGAVARECGHALRGLLTLALWLLVLVALAALGLGWRLSQGPLEVPWLARQAEAAVNVREGGARLVIGGAALEWGGFHRGAGAPLGFALRDVMVVNGAAVAVLRAGLVEGTLRAGPLLRGQVALRTVHARGLELALRRGPAGLALDLGGLVLEDEGAPPAQDLATIEDVLRALAAPPSGEEAGNGPPWTTALQSVRVEEARVQVHDPFLQRVAGGAVVVEVARLVLERPESGGVSGEGVARVLAGPKVGGAVAALTLRAEVSGEGETAARVELAPVDAGSMQAALPALDDVAPRTLEAAVRGVATARLSARLRPMEATLRLEAGAGRLRAADTLIGFDRMVADLEAAWTRPGWRRPDRVVAHQVQAVVHAPGGAWPTTVTLKGEAALGDRIEGKVMAALDHLSFTDLGVLWPEALGGHVRPWLVENITAGVARDGAVALGFVTDNGLSDVAITSIDGSMVGENVTIHWLKPVPPVEGAQAVLTIKGLEELTIAIPSAHQGNATLSNGSVRIVGLAEKDQVLSLQADVAGQVPELIALLRHKRLRLLDRKPIPMRDPAGRFTGRLNVTVPLEEHLQFEDVKIGAQVRATELRLGGLIAGRDLDRGDVRFDVTQDSLRAQGTAAVAGILGQMQVEMDFRNGPASQVVQRATATGRATAVQLAAAGLDAAGVMTGPGAFTAQYSQRRDGSGEIVVKADLREAALKLPGWSKAPGQPAEGQAVVRLRGDALAGIDAIRMAGPGMAIEGRAEMVGNRPLLLVLSRAVLGATQASGQVRFPAGPNEVLEAKLQGAMLDLSAELARPDTGERGDPWVAEVRFDRVRLSDKGVLEGVVAKAGHDGRRLNLLDATTQGAARATASIRPQGTGRRLVVRAEDGGAALRAMDFVDDIVGGTLALDAVYDDTRRPAPLAGEARLSGFSVKGAPAFGKLLQAVTIYGVVEALSGPGLSFREGVMPFSWDGRVLEVDQARAFSASLGLTARGRVDTARKTVDLKGTVVPAYVFNSLLGRIPLLGRLFSAEQGGGLVAVDYTMRGPSASPSVSVNPLSALTPGFLRGLFRLFD